MATARAGARHLERTTQRARAQRLLALDFEREPADGRLVCETLARPPDRYAHDDQHREPHDERQDAREIDPPRTAQSKDAGGQQERRDADGSRAARGGNEARQPAALAVAEIDDRDAVGRLVTA